MKEARAPHRPWLFLMGVLLLTGCASFMPGADASPQRGDHDSTATRPQGMTSTVTDPVQSTPIRTQQAIPSVLSLPAWLPTDVVNTSTSTASHWMTDSPTRGELVVWIGCLLIWRLVSRAWQARRQQRQLQERLETALQGRLQAQRHFHAMLSHELRGPIATVHAHIDRLDELPMNPRAQHQVRRIRQGVGRIGALIDQLLSLTRAHLEPANTDKTAHTQVQPVLREVLEELLPKAMQRAQQVALVKGHDACVAVSSFDLQTLLRNLIDNAIRYTHQGGQIDISVFTWTDRVWLQVADNGPGIAEDALARVFDPFFRIEQQVDGTGLGLAIVQRLALRWQGKIVLRNRSTGGLVASLELPAALPHLR